jgi:hypothetical protein
MGLFAFLVLPFDFGMTNIFLLWALRFVKVSIISIAIGFWETYVTKLRIFR